VLGFFVDVVRGERVVASCEFFHPLLCVLWQAA
jgi:hypothetical protein